MRASRLITIALSLLSTGCEDLNGPISGRELKEIARARVLWNGSQVRHAYRYELRQGCFCPPEITSWNTITVIDGVITDVRSERGDAVPRNRWGLFATVDELFASLADRQSADVKDITVRFDPRYGYPVEMSFIYPSDFLDAGNTYSARNLQEVTR
jgi:hypothetical protein